MSNQQSRNQPFIWGLSAAGITLMILLLASCGALDRVGERPAGTETNVAQRTATFGGRISVWIVSPTGAVFNTNSQGQTPISSSSQGEIVEPVGTATAISATLYAATQTAAAPQNVPNFQTTDCPLPSGRVPESRPDSFAQFPSAIGAYLSEGGPVAVLENELRVWGAINQTGGMIQADTDLTGDGVEEIVVNLYNPLIYNPDSILNAGQLLVYGCDNGRYRLLYQTPNSPGLALPVVHRVGDMNGDVKAELVFDIQSCSQSSCTRTGQILTWNPITGVFEPLNNQEIISANGRLGILDIDSDGILELTSSSNPIGNVSSGPRRSVVDIWDWTGKNYILAIRQQDEAKYRIHVMHDADAALRRGASSRATAIEGYQAVRDDEELLGWTTPNERQVLRAFASYRLVTIYARYDNSDTRSVSMRDSLVAENPEGTPGAVYAAMGQAFMTEYLASRNPTTACQAALAVASGRPEALSSLGYGYANPIYTLADLCPF